MGLGNPGPDFQDTRHNAGFWFLDQWAGNRGLSFRKPWFRPFLFASAQQNGNTLVFVKPLTFVNRSGQLFPHLLSRFGATADDLVVVFDQMDLPAGRARMKPHGSSGGHNGLKSIDQALGHGRYHRIAVGVGRPGPGVSVVDHVLGAPDPGDRVSIDATLGRVIQGIDERWWRGWEPWINAVNQRDADRS